MEQSTRNIDFNLFAFSDWSDFYNKPADETYIKKSSRLTGSQSSYFVSFCKFINQTTIGAISFSTTSTSTNFLVEDSLFSGCSSTGNGGSLLFEKDGQCAQNRICSFESKIEQDNSYGAYCHADVSENSPFHNKITDSSISKTGDQQGIATIDCLNGAANISSINVSHTNINYLHGCYLQSINSDSILFFSTFANNTQKTLSSTAAFYGSSSTPSMQIKYCNYLNNNVTHTTIGCNNLNSLIFNCNFVNNINSDRTFYHSGSGSETVDHCYFDNFKGISGTVVITNTMNQRINLKLSTFECEAEFPLLKHEKTPEIVHKIIEIIPLCVNMTFSI